MAEMGETVIFVCFRGKGGLLSPLGREKDLEKI